MKLSVGIDEPVNFTHVSNVEPLFIEVAFSGLLAFEPNVEALLATALVKAKRALLSPDTLMLPFCMAASAVGKVCGVAIPTTGTRSEPTSAATTTRVTFERNPSRIFFVLKENMLNL
jgi:hypothetical protein